jgi:uncharacterized protein (TIGR02594 family)
MPRLTRPALFALAIAAAPILSAQAHEHPARRLAHAHGSNDARAREIAEANGAENPLVVEAEKYVGSGNLTGFRGQWCGAFMGLVAERTGHRAPDGFRKASEWLKAGHRISRPQVGAIAVLRSHVGVIAAVADDGRLVLVSGNHTGGRVGYGLYDPRRVLGYVTLS